MRTVRSVAVLLALVVFGSGLLANSASASSVSASSAGGLQTYVAPASGSWTVIGHGNGHGHGLSQYGAYGRALAGQQMPAILSFYYPGTTLQSGPPRPGQVGVAQTPIRVLLSRAGGYTTIAAAAGITVTGVTGALNPAGLNEFRLVPAGTGLGVQSLALAPGSAWQPVTGDQSLPATATFSSSAGPLTLVRADGSRGLYRGTVTGIRTGAAVMTVNTLDLDDYVRGVAPNESPSSWPAAALQAQVVAARTYALFEIRERAGAGNYDVCDSSACQVYGGASSERPSTDAAVTATAGTILTYAGSPIFAQFTSSNGGWTAEGGKPYLIAQPDPFDNASTDPWFSWTRTVPVAQVGAYYGLSTVTDIRVLTRDGHGDWGGGVTTLAIDGSRGGVPTSVSTDGYSIRSAMGLPLQWFTITNGAPAPVALVLPSAPANLMLQLGSGAVTVTWSAPPPNATAPVSRYVITISGLARRAISANARVARFTGLVNGRTYRVAVQAVNAHGAGPSAALVAMSTALPAGSPPAVAQLAQSSANRSAAVFWLAPPSPAGLGVTGRLGASDPITGYLLTVVGRASYRLPATARHLVLAPLPNGAAQTVYVRAIDHAGIGAAVVVGIRPTPHLARPAVIHFARTPAAVAPVSVAPAVSPLGVIPALAALARSPIQ
jgi:stage II sporulation protein D